MTVAAGVFAWIGAILGLFAAAGALVGLFAGASGHREFERTLQEWCWLFLLPAIPALLIAVALIGVRDGAALL